MIENKNNIFGIHGDGFSMLFKVNDYGLLELIHFGERVKTSDADALSFRQGLGWGTSVLLKAGDTASCADAMPLLWSGSGRGDYRESPLELLGISSDFRYVNHEIVDGIVPMDGVLPQAKGDAQSLVITLAQPGLELKLIFSLFDGVVTRRVKLINKGAEPVSFNKLMSSLVDIYGDYEMTTFDGGWLSEMHPHKVAVKESRVVNESITGFSSQRHNPGVLISAPSATEDSGRVYGFNLVYSGNHYTSAQLSKQGFTRVVQGISPSNFMITLQPGDTFETPEAVMAFSAEGFGGLSRKMHAFVNNHIVPEYWQGRERPILFNSWEGCMFDFNERRLVDLAKTAKELGCELFVLDDGWFGKRNDDHAGLGDYNVNMHKLPHGLAGLGKRINDLGMQFGLWFEPESVNPDSDLYRAHPDWILSDGFEPLQSRNQLHLDLTKPEVRDYIVENVSRTLDSAPISYVKWDMNRHSIALGAKAHEFILGTYDVLHRVFGPRPHILLESCSSGGNRFDLGMLTFGPQAWCSDNTDPIEREIIQNSITYLYPQSSFGAHVSEAPHIQTLRPTPLATRANIAFFGCLGYELDLKHLSKLEKQEVAEQIAFYKENRKLFQFGEFSRLENGWQVNLGEKSAAVVFRGLVESAPPYELLRLKGLKSDASYNFESRHNRLRVGQFGSLVKYIAPVDLHPDGVVLRTADKLLTIPDGHQQAKLSGAALMAGTPLLPLFRGTGYDTNQRTFNDFGSELYIIEETQDEEC